MTVEGEGNGSNLEAADVVQQGGLEDGKNGTVPVAGSPDAGTPIPDTPAVVEDSFDLNSIFKKVETKTEAPKIEAYDSGLVAKLLGGGDKNGADKARGTEGTSGDAGEKTADSKATGEPEALADKPETPVAQVVKFKAGDKEVEIPETATIKIQVNGKEEEFTVADLKRDVQGRIPWNEHYRKLKEDRKVFDGERTRHQNQIKAEQEAHTKIMALAKSDPWGALVELAIAKGENPATFLPEYLKQAQVTIEHMGRLSQEELDLTLREKALEYKDKLHKNKEAETETETKKAEAEATMVRYIASEQKKHNMPDAEMIAAFKFLDECDKDASHPFKFGPDCTEMDKINSVIHYITDFQRPHARVEKIVKTIDPEAAKDVAFLMDLHKTTLDSYPDMPDTEIKEIVEGLLGKSKATQVPQPSTTVQASSSKDLSTGNQTRPTPEKTPQREEVRTEGKAKYSPRSMEDIIAHYRG